MSTSRHASHRAQLLVRMARAIQGGAAPSPDFADALEHQRLLDLVERSSETGQRQVLRQAR